MAKQSNKQILAKLVKLAEANDQWSDECQHYRVIWDQLSRDASMEQLLGYARSSHGPDTPLDQQALIMLARVAIHHMVLRGMFEERKRAALEAAGLEAPSALFPRQPGQSAGPGDPDAMSVDDCQAAFDAPAATVPPLADRDRG